MNDIIEAEEVVAARGVKVVFGAVRALDGADLVIRTGECLGLVGHNGAGKSTIVNVINGGLTPHEGSVSYGGNENRHGIAAARANGVRCVFQELSLCPNLTISENVRIMHAATGGRNWRGRALTTIRQTLDEIFPGHGIDCELTVAELSIAERQMVEIAINFCRIPHAPRLVIIDEPTSSLDAGLAEQLMDYVRRFVREGGSVLLISHILGEILSTATRIVVMKDGRVVADRKAADFTTRSLVEAMGSVVKEQDRRRGESRKAGEKVPSKPFAAKSSALPVSAAMARPKRCSIFILPATIAGCPRARPISPSSRATAA
jgi:ribose transport system ATP-binding protein